MSTEELKKLINTIQPNTQPKADVIRSILEELLKRIELLEKK